MENIRGFIEMYIDADNIWIIIAVAAILVITIIGYFADRANRKIKENGDAPNPRPKKEKKKKNKKGKVDKEGLKDIQEDTVKEPDNDDNLNTGLNTFDYTDSIEEPEDSESINVNDPFNITNISEEPISMGRDLSEPTSIDPTEELRTEPVDIGEDPSIGMDPLKMEIGDAASPGPTEPELSIPINEEANPIEDIERLGEASIQEQIMSPNDDEIKEEEVEIISDDEF